LTGVGAIICAAHAERLSGVVHGHTYEVTAWHECPDSNDAVILQNHLQGVCSAFDHTTLAPELSRAEDLAAAILRLSPPTCVEVEIRRPLERLYAKATA
jgi:6-pyruvoyl-tetrahydropterin synthase